MIVTFADVFATFSAMYERAQCTEHPGGPVSRSSDQRQLEWSTVQQPKVQRSKTQGAEEWSEFKACWTVGAGFVLNVT